MSPEHVSRRDDERLYQPRIHSRHIRNLHRLSLETGEPLTVLVDRALAEFVARHEALVQRRDGVTNLVAERAGAVGAQG
ncbi:MAG: hypothetical protein GX597_25700 [Anaerolineaceae bacterium]|nr:hypothetical protein [Anaerolineaceae bacterium]